MRKPNLGIDALRTITVAQQLGGFVQAAQHVGRSQAAVSQQIRKLEQQLGTRLFEKAGRRLVPTPAGEILSSYARRMLALNDEAVIAVHGNAVAGTVRFGVPGDLADTWLPPLLARLLRAIPALEVEVVVDRNRSLTEMLDRGELDLVIALNQEHRHDAVEIAKFEMHWIGIERGAADQSSPLPLVLSSAPCFFRNRALAALEQAERPWRVVLSSPSVHGVWAAVSAGLGVTPRLGIGMPANLCRLIGEGLPSLGESIALCVHDGGRKLSSAADQLRLAIVGTIEET